MLETIHEYARERLAESGEELEIRDRHLEFFLSLAEEMEPGYRQHGQLMLLERTEAELDNLRAAFEWALERGNIEAAARLISAIDYFLYYRDRFVEGYRWFNRVLGEMAKIPCEHQVRLLLGAGRLAWTNGELSQSKRFSQKALTLARELGDRLNEARLLENLAICFVDHLEDYEEAVGYAKEALTIFQELDDKPGVAMTLNILGELARVAGDYDQAREMYEASLAMCQKTGEIMRQIMHLSNLAYVDYHNGNYEHAKELMLSSLEKAVEIESKQAAIDALWGIVGPLTKLGEPEKASQLLGASAALSSEMGFYHQPSDMNELVKYTADVKSQLDEATFEAAYAEGQAMTLEQAVAYALEE